ncbi:MAG: hypothetical protein WC389_05400 [Lutibacter sp.]|jgi:hypothetical protein
MEYLQVNQNTFDNIQGMNDLEMVDNVSKLAKKRSAKLTKKAAGATGKKKAKLTKRAATVAKKGTLLGRIGHVVAAVSTGGVSLLASKKGRSQLKKAGKVVGKGAVLSALLPILPLVPMMRKSLEKKGVKTKKGQPLETLNLFYKNVVQGKQGNWEAIDLLETPEDNLAPVIGVVVSAVISFIKALKKKKADGKTLTKTEQVIVDGTEEAEKQIIEKAKEEAAGGVGKKLLFDRKTQMIIIGVVLLLGVIVYTVSRKHS